MTCKMCPTPCGPAEEEPFGIEVEADGIFVKQMYIPKANTIVFQHSHVYDHLTMVARGALDVFLNGNHLGEFRAPTSIMIRANASHRFVSLEDDTVAYCIHRVDQTGEIEINGPEAVGGSV